MKFITQVIITCLIDVEQYWPKAGWPFLHVTLYEYAMRLYIGTFLMANKKTKTKNVKCSKCFRLSRNMTQPNDSFEAAGDHDCCQMRNC